MAAGHKGSLRCFNLLADCANCVYTSGMTPFTSPPDVYAFRSLVWEIARQVPPGCVTTYGQIASMIPPPQGMAPPDYDAQAPRWVGGAMNACPQDVPWQRVINSQGKISIKGPTGEEQKQLLQAEGVQFDVAGKVDLAIYGWEGPAPEWLQAHHLQAPLKFKRGGQLAFF